MESGETVMSRSMMWVRIPIFARRIPARRPVGPAPEMRTGTSVFIGDAVADAPSEVDERENVVMRGG